MCLFRSSLAGLLLLLGACSAPAAKPTVPSTTTIIPSAAKSAAMVMAPAVSTLVPVVPGATVAPPPLPAKAVSAVPPPTHRISHVSAPARPAADAEISRSVATPAPGRSQLSGHVELGAARGQQVAAGELADTLVYFEPSAGTGRVKPGQFTVYTHNRDFSPEAIAIPLGSTVTFVNLDDVRHNVFSVTPGSPFDLGYQGAGEKASHTFTRPGVVLIGCNVHRSMELDMLVVATPYVGNVAADGSFTLRGLPAGRGTLHFWNPRAQPVSRAVTLPLAESVTQKLLAIKPRMDTQLNTGTSP